MAASRHPPAQPGASSVGQSGQGEDQATDRPASVRKTKTYGPPALPPPFRTSPPLGPGHPLARREDEGDEQTTVDPQAPKNLRETLQPTPLPAPQPLGQSESFPKSSAAKPAPYPRAESYGEASPFPQPAPLADPVEPGPPAAPEAADLEGAESVEVASDDPDSIDVDVDQKSTMTEAISEDSSDILIDPPPGGPGSALDSHLASGTGETSGGSVDEPTQEESASNAPQLAVVREAARALQPRPGARIPSVPSDPSLSPAWLVVQSGTDRGRRFALRGGRTSVGRGVDNDVVLTDIAVSRKHLVIEFARGGYVMNDLGSGNGTVVNDRDEDGAYHLTHGDKLELGNTVLMFECTVADLQPQPLGKWSNGEEDDLSTVAGHRPKGAVAGGNGGSASPQLRQRAPSVPPPLPRPRGPRTSPMGSAQPPPLVPRPPGPSHSSGPAHSTAPPISAAATSHPLVVPPPRSASGAPPTRRPAASTAPPHAPTISSESPLANRSLLPPGASAFSPYPAPARGPNGPGGATGRRPLGPPSIAYPTAPPGYAMPNTSPAPRFQYPNGVMAPLPAGERRRVLIGILGIAFVAVGAGIVMALVHGSSGDGEAAKPRARAARAAADTSSSTESAASTTTPAPATPAPADPAIADGAGSQEGTAQPTTTATASPPPGSGAAQPSPVELHQLYGDHELRPVDFGTDEQFLSDVAREEADPGAATTATAPATSDEDETEAEEEAAEPEAGEEPPPRKRSRRRSRTREAEATEVAPNDADFEEVADAGSDDGEEDEDSGSRGDSVSASGALRQAGALYRNKKFSEAAGVLRRAAESAGRRDSSRLRALSANYARIGELLAEGQTSLVSDSPRALTAFKSALRLDEEFGESVHDRTIGARIAQVAPAAAGAYMARRDYAEAKSAADVAEKFGSGDSDRVRMVRGSLERKAEQLYQEAKSQAEAGDTDEAAETARLILRMVPRSSDLYNKAARLAGD
jgi:tetratricopeptide (TPR) repeat protein